MSQTSIETDSQIVQPRFRPLKVKIKGNFTLRSQSRPYDHRTVQNDEEHEIEVEAVEGLGSGLAFRPVYWLPLAEPEERGDEEYQDNHNDRDDHEEEEEDHEEENWGSGYVLTHLASGYCLGHWLVDTPRQARLWLQLVASLTDWRRPAHELVRGQQALQGLARQVEQARKEAIVGCSYLG